MKKTAHLPYTKFKGAFYPIIRIEIAGSAGSVETKTFVDSGASISIFLTSVADAIGIDYSAGKLSYTMVGDGNFIPVYLHKIPIKIGHFSFKATIGFSPNLGADFNLLGQRDIFDRFAVTFDSRRKAVCFRQF